MQVLAPLLMSGAAAQLLRSPSRATKARGVELLQEMLRCPGIATAINTAAQGLLGAAPSQQQQPQQHSGPAGSGARSHPLQPSNRAAAGSILTSLAKASSQQAAAKAAAAAAAGAHTHSSGSQMAPGVWESLSAGLLDCLSCPIEDAGPAPSSRGSSSGGARSTFVSSAAGTGASLAWGRYELHRRALALVAGLLQSGQVAAVLGLLHEELSSGGCKAAAGAWWACGSGCREVGARRQQLPGVCVGVGGEVWVCGQSACGHRPPVSAAVVLQCCPPPLPQPTKCALLRTQCTSAQSMHLCALNTLVRTHCRRGAGAAATRHC